MSTFEVDWEVGVLVTAEAVYGIGFPLESEVEAAADVEMSEARADAAD